MENSFFLKMTIFEISNFDYNNACWFSERRVNGIEYPLNKKIKINKKKKNNDNDSNFKMLICLQPFSREDNVLKEQTSVSLLNSVLQT